MKRADLIEQVRQLLPEHERTYEGKAFYAAMRRIVINNKENSPIVRLIPVGRRAVGAGA